MAALTNLSVGSTVVYQDDYYTHVWHGGCLVSILYNETGVDCDCWNYGKLPLSVAEAVEWAAERAQSIAEDDGEEQDAMAHFKDAFL